MSAEAFKTTPPDSEAPDTPREVVEWPLKRGDLAVHVDNSNWYFILGRWGPPAGEIPAAYGGTLDEWLDCDPDASILMAVTVERLKQSVARIDRVEDILQAVKDGVVNPCGVPEARVGIALEEFIEEEAAGNWDGLRDYLREQKEVADA
jgi:hypothetical protein